jgi:hypothetical protein
MNLYEVTLHRTYTPFGLLLGPPGVNPRVTKRLSWGTSQLEVLEQWTEAFAQAGSYWHARFMDSVHEIKPVDPEPLRERTRNSTYPTCCDLAIFVDCVCLYSTSCPTHGTQCHGTHD